MVSVLKGLNVQKSRFAVLSVEQDSEEEDDKQWEQVSAPKKTGQKKGGSSQSGKAQAQGGGEESKVLSKNAKKRARKRRNKSTSSDHDGGEPVGDAVTESRSKEDVSEVTQYDGVWKQKNEQAMENEFQKDLREALLQSTVDAQQEKLLRQRREAEEKAMTAQLEAEVAASALPGKTSSKKLVKLSLQELHSLPSQDQVSVPPELARAPYPTTPSYDNAASALDEGLEEDKFLQDVEAEVRKEMSRPTTHAHDKVLSKEEKGMIPRIAQLEDELEKRDKIIARLKKENATLKKSLTEVKERNQSLCTIMSQGEFSKKAELIKQVDELATVKNDLTSEVENLSSLLEQERSKSKAMKLELTKLQNSHSKTSKSSSH